MSKTLLIIAGIALINSLGYGIIIPILYSYSLQFGLNDFENGMLFAIFSLCQFLATPFIGRLSDKYGRKPLLLLSLSGTALSFFLAAFAPNALFLFIARALDGITAGNIPVASAVISDTTNERERAKGFGIIGASFGFGFIFGPAIATLTLSYGMNMPFIIAGVVSLITVIFTAVFLPETNRYIGQVEKKHILQILDIQKLATAIKDEKIGITLLLSLLYNIAFGLFIFTFQPHAVKTMGLSANIISLIYTIYGIVGIVTQVLLVPRIVKNFGERKSLILCFALVTLVFAGMYKVSAFSVFVFLSIVFGFANGFFLPIIQTLLSKEVDAKSQGSVLGLNSSYVSLGMIVGPVLGGVIATLSIPLPFIFGSIITLVCLIIAQTKLKDHYPSKEHLI
ncbi:MAG: tetracycline resistance MFS efflux pump [Patescibacteria group bacterium]|nr:MAG: tetracycline resistance MFS efflux pump [Patescibacteria group bacterium]